jgi:hypothetical protein
LQNRRNALIGDLDGHLVDAPAGAAGDQDEHGTHIEPVSSAQWRSYDLFCNAHEMMLMR